MNAPVVTDIHIFQVKINVQLEPLIKLCSQVEVRRNAVLSGALVQREHCHI